MSTSYPNPNKYNDNMSTLPTNYTNGPLQPQSHQQSQQQPHLISPLSAFTQSNNQPMNFNLKPINSSASSGNNYNNATLNQQNIATTTSTSSSSIQSNLPQHMRSNMPLLNGGGGGSSHSSRTGSPAMNNTTNIYQKSQNQQPIPSIPTLQNANQNLSMSMQNLALNNSQQNVLPGQVGTNQQQQQQQQQQQKILTNNSINQHTTPINNQAFYPYNFKTNALKNLDSQSNRSSTNSTPVLQNSNQNIYHGIPTVNANTPILSNNMPPMPPPSVQSHPSITSSIPQTNLTSPSNFTRPSMPPTQQNIQGIKTLNSNLVNNNNIQQIPPFVKQNNMPPLPTPNQLPQNLQNQPLVSSIPPSNNQSQQPIQPMLPNTKPAVAPQSQPSFPPPINRKPMYPPQSGVQNYNQNYVQSQQPSIPVQQPILQQQQPSTPQQQQYQQQQSQQTAYNGHQNSGQVQHQQNIGSVTHQGFNRLWGQDIIDLMQHRHILSPTTLEIPRIPLNNQFQESVNCNPDIMRCTLNRIPESNSLLQKSRLPLGILVHPFRDINSLPVIQCPNIVRCRLCRTYINPFVHFVDSKMWKCNLCYRVNELPEDFQYDPASKTYGDVTRRPEVRSSTIEFIAPSEYMLRPPQPAIYLFLFDVSILAQQSGYLDVACSTLLKYLDEMPGDKRAQVGFIAYNSAIHFYNIAEGSNQPREMTLVDIEDPFIPCPDNLLVNLKECKELVKDLLNKLPTRFSDSHDPGSCMGAALQVAYKLMMASGGRVTVFQTCLPNKGVGLLEPREDPNNRSSKDVAHLNPATDFYKRHALECSGYQIAVDLFVLNQQYVDLATMSGISKHSGGSIHHFPLFQKTKPNLVDSFRQSLKRYFTRKIGFEAVMRIRCTRGLQVHTFHGNFFVRSTDLLSLPNVNPDAGYGMQISYEENLSDIKTICFQAALLYTNSEGERRIRVHTLCLPITNNLNEVMHSADSQAIIGLLSKMAVDRSLTSSLADAREAFINATIDILSAFKLAQNYPGGQSGQLMAPKNLALLPLYILALLKHMAFRVGTSTRLDDRIAAMDAMKNLPLDQLMKYIYPEFYHLDTLFYNLSESPDEEETLPDVPLRQLTAEFLDSRSMFLIDSGQLIIIYVGLNVPQNILESVLGVKSTAEIPDICFNLPSIDTAENCALKCFIDHLNEEKPYLPTIQIIRDTSTCKSTFMEKLVDDRSESSLSYYEFLQHLRTQVK